MRNRGLALSPLLRTTHAPENFYLRENSTYLYAPTGEERTQHVSRWVGNSGGSILIQVSNVQPDGCTLTDSSGSSRTLDVRDLGVVRSFLETLSGTLYLDITGMAHHIWAPIVRAANGMPVILRAIYAEPREYRLSRDATEEDVFDLSRRIDGISPIPGFTVLRDPQPESSYLVPLIGFEGARLMNIVNEVQPRSDRIFPIVGLPGFRPEYQFHALLGNRRALEATGAWKQLHYAMAACPFAAYYEIERVYEDSPGRYLRLAPIGTRPHALAAVAFVTTHFETSELVFDYPLEIEDRTSGLGILHEYNLSALLRIG